MALLKLKCPECNTGLKSATGFTPGQTVCCPKCETYFPVEEPAEEEAEEKPGKGKEKAAPAGKKSVKAAAADEDDEEQDAKPKKKKKKKASEDDEDEESGSYKKSPIRFVILGVLLMVMVVLGVMLYLKKRNEAREAKARDEEAAAQKKRDEEPPPPIRPIIPKKELSKNQPGKQPMNPNGGGGLNVADVAFDALGGLLGGGRPVPFEQAQALTQKYKTALIGAWSADLGSGVTEELTYKADGMFTAARAGPSPTTATGRYVVKSLVGTKGLRIQQDTAAGTREIVAVFEDNELHHSSLQQGVTATFRKK